MLTTEKEAYTLLPEEELATTKVPLDLIQERIRLMRIGLGGMEDYIMIRYMPELQATMLTAHKGKEVVA